MRTRTIETLSIIMFILGLCILFYPKTADTINKKAQEKIIYEYISEVGESSEDYYDRLFAEAKIFNQKLYEKGNLVPLTEEEMQDYHSLLNPRGDGIIGVVPIPKIGIDLPIAHTSTEEVLQKTAGHLEVTSLPIGGKNTHALINAHSGLPSAKLFTDLEKIEVGDRFTIRVLNQKLVYEVDNISVISPTDISKLQIQEGMDYVTLMTCIPYAVNTHRFLVRGRGYNCRKK